MEGKIKKNGHREKTKTVELGGGMYSWNLFDVVQLRNTVADVELQVKPTSQAPIL